MNECIHGVDLREEFCNQGQCLTWQKKHVPHLVPKQYGGTRPCPGADGLLCVDGWLYSGVGGMIFPANKKCPLCNPFSKPPKEEKMVILTTRNLHQLATMCHDRAEEYRAPYLADPERDGQTAFVTSGSYPIYATLQEMWLMFNKFADNLDEEFEALKKGEKDG